MGVYAGTLTADSPHAIRLGVGREAMLHGTFNITNYNSTMVDAGIAKFFKTVKRVVCSGVSSNGYLVKWDATAASFKAYYPVTAHSHDLLLKSGAGGDGAVSIETTSGPILRIETIGADQTVAGASSATKGGVQAATPAAGTEVANDVAVGTVDFVAFGII